MSIADDVAFPASSRCKMSEIDRGKASSATSGLGLVAAQTMRVKLSPYLQIFVDAFSFKQVTCFVVVQLNQPAEYIARPFAVRKQLFWFST